MNLVNNVTLIGNLGADPKIREFENGNMVANFSLLQQSITEKKMSLNQKLIGTIL